MNGYRYGYLQAGTGKARGMKMSLMARIRLRKRRKKADDLAMLRGRWGL